MVTCYDYSSARAVAESSIDCIRQRGHDDARVFQYSFGYHPNDGLAHCRGRQGGSVQVHRRRLAVSFIPQRIEGAMDSVHDLMSAGAHAVKLEGVHGHAEIVRHIVDSGVPVMGHLGLTPQSFHGLGGMKI